ncbi:MAG TPA: DUF5134 domain-containing protein [Acidimicrobiales bacterium]|nr:DUF5134 domain-containing protein [Acidimicrobiales bacterium]
MTATPAWLYHLFGTLMLAVAAYCLAGLVVGVVRHRASGRDIDIAHTCMGLSMAGMFVAQWAFGRNAMWELIFGALLIWFAVRSIQSVQRYGLHVPHEAIHTVMSFSMLLMYWFPMGSSSGSMSMASSSAARVDPGLAFVLAFTLLASAIFTLASPVKGASHHGTHVRAYAMSGPVRSEIAGGRAGEAPGPAGGIEGLITTPWLEDASHAVMCVAMAFMLVLML